MVLSECRWAGHFSAAFLVPAADTGEGGPTLCANVAHGGVERQSARV